MSHHPFLDDDLRDRAAQYVLGLLSEAEARSLRLHLGECATCRTEIGALHQLSRDLCLLYPAESPTADLWSRVIERISSVESRAEGRSDAELGSLAAAARLDARDDDGAAAADGSMEERGTRERTDTGASVLAQVWKTWTCAPGGSADFTLVGESESEWQSTAVEGIAARRLFVDADQDRATFLVRMAPGSAYPAHVHAGPEECFVLEGDLDVGELRMRAGDFQRAETGSLHGVQSTDTGCLLLITSSLKDEIVA